MDFNPGRKVPFPGFLNIGQFRLLSDEELQIGGLFYQGQFSYSSGYGERRVQHFPDFNLESFFISKNIFDND